MAEEKKILALDTETHMAEMGRMAPRLVCCSMANRNQTTIKTRQELEPILEATFKAAVAGKVLIVGQRIAFDMAVILENFPSLWDLVWKAYRSNAITCTAIRERLLDIAVGQFQFYVDENGNQRENSYSLEDIARKRLKREVNKGADTWRTKYAELDGVPLEQWPQAAVVYSKQDAEITFQIYKSQVAQAKSINYPMPTEFDETRADFALQLLTVWGVETDGPRVRLAWNIISEKMRILAVELEKAGLVSKTKGEQLELFPEQETDRVPLPDVKKNMDRIRQAILKHYPGIPPETPGHQIRTDADVVAACSWEPLKKLSEFSGLQKTASTYLSKLFVPVVHARFYAIGAKSGRTSSSGPNMQNPPRLVGVRECIIPRKNRVFVSADFDSQEMRTLAQSCLDICGRSKLAEMYQHNPHFDPHIVVAARLAGISVEDALAKKKEGDPRIKELRQQAKIANFGYGGGMAPQTFVEYARGWGVDVTLAESEKLREMWLEQWPEMRIYFNHVSALVGPGGVGEQIIQRSGFRRGSVGYTDAANGYFQTLAAHASKAALWEVSRRCYSEPGSWLYGSRPVLFIHDEIILETPEAVVHEAAQELERVLVESMARFTPNVPPAASALAMRRWTKQAQRTTDAEGILIPWEDFVNGTWEPRERKVFQW